MDSQTSKKRTRPPSRKRFCSSCQKEIEPNTGGLCLHCQKKLEIIKNAHKNEIPIKEELLSPNRNNSVYDIIEEFKLLLSIRENNYADSLTHERKLVSLFRNIFSTENSAHIFFYFCKYGAATAQVLQVQLSMNYQVVYRVIRNFSNLGIIFPSQKIRKYAKSKGGPRYEVWSLSGADRDDIVECIKLHRRCISPKYRLAEEIIPTILDDFILKRNVKEITKRELIQYVKDTKLVQFNAHDIIELAIPIIQSKGIKVWR